MSKKTVLVTGCSDGGMGSALAIALHEVGFRVIASARNPAKLSEVKGRGIETIALDVRSEESLQAAVLEVSSLTGGSLDVLINNAGIGYMTALSDASISKSKDIFDVNVWGLLSTTQSFLPLLLQSKKGAMVVNNTSIDSVVSAPFQGVYNASKAAAAMISANFRLELSSFGIKVIDLKTGGVKTNFWANTNKVDTKLPPNSLYTAASASIEKSMRGDPFEPSSVDRHVWAKAVAGDLSKASPPLKIWRGDSAFTIWIGTFLPMNAFDSVLKKMTGLSELERQIRIQGKDKIVADSGFISKSLQPSGLTATAI
jgi:1-acylglycerone phosphate reductase